MVYINLTTIMKRNKAYSMFESFALIKLLEKLKLTYLLVLALPLNSSMLELIPKKSPIAWYVDVGKILKHNEHIL